jgi:DNA-binding transcriptional LysR family regulator
MDNQVFRHSACAMNQVLSIRAFARVAEVGSFTRAADSLDIPKATVSKLVQDLEAHLGVRLLQRTTRKVVVTPDGRAYYERTARLIRELEDVDSSFSGAKGKPRGKIRVDTSGAPGRNIVIPALPQFFERYPDITIDLGVSDRPVDLVTENVDCVIRGGPMNELSNVARHLARVSMSTAATPGYLKKFGTPKHPRDLQTGHKIVGYRLAETGRAMPTRFERNGQKFEFDGPTCLNVNDGAARLVGGLAGLGVMQTFSFLMRPYIESGALIPILDDWRPPPYPFYAMYPANRHMNTRVRVFVDWLIELFGSLELDAPVAAAAKRRCS